ncbi:hypothetical protein CC86DRAFT_401968 [Ophiobolus disseminans]|uniref:Heterokaryon incompatibility domain-containing protein n=1 Tax=Ophiobolus disseminans TaxID=1469910 RepID=A0A6A7ADQ0_9PLEO|nr:hypothetical protein CC86DRAFT_401968 [Ophiobolus disseminans]
MSATASEDGHGGLFRNRIPEFLQEDVVDVYFPKPDNPLTGDFTRCKIVNASVWLELVDQAPINTRTWVVQERLLAPRVLHFCHDQIAWECSKFDDAECFPEAVTSLKADLRGMAPHGRTKDLTTSAGMRSRDICLDELPDPDVGMQDLYVFELWKRMVEGYSRTDLSYPSDVFMALTGIARHFQKHLFSTSTNLQYVAGLWSRNLESQLLWCVNEEYRGDQFHNPSKRYEERAPSFSWAAVCTPYGITYGDTTDYGVVPTLNEDRAVECDDMVLRSEVRGWIGVTPTKTPELADNSMEYLDTALQAPKPDPELFFKILDHSITLFDAQNPFGMVTNGQLLLRPQYLRRIELVRMPEEHKCSYRWCLHPRTSLEKRSRWQFGNNYFDAPDSDTEVYQEGAELFVMPAAYGERTVPIGDEHLYCLLLKFEGLGMFPKVRNGARLKHQGLYRVFSRFGLTKLSSWVDGKGQKELKAQDANEIICLM